MSGRRALVTIALASALCGCPGMRIEQAQDEVKIALDRTYVAGSQDPKQRLDLYLPRRTSVPGAKFPVVLFVHGGFWRSQDRRYFQSLSGIYGNVGVALARRGIGVCVMSYRLSPAVGIQEQLADVLAALRWVQSNIDAQGGDRRRMVLGGYSAGGHLATLLGLDVHYMERAGLDASGSVRGYFSLSGIVDVPAMAAQQDSEFNRDVSFRLFGQTPAEQARLSPSSFVRADAPPMLFLAAERDYPFVRSAARETAARLEAVGARASTFEIADYDHEDMVLNVGTSDDRVTDLVAAFVRSVTR